MVMFFSILIGMIIMCFILIAEIIYEPKARLSWPYGDLVPGSYLSKISLPMYCTLIALISFKVRRFFLFSSCVSLISLALVFLTGERGNFFIRFFSGILALFSWKNNKHNLIKSFLILTGITSIFLSLFFSFNYNKHFERYTTNFYNSIPFINTSDNNPYWGAWRSGIQQGFINPLIGLGPSSSRKHCKILPEKKTRLVPW